MKRIESMLEKVRKAGYYASIQKTGTGIVVSIQGGGMWARTVMLDRETELVNGVKMRILKDRCRRCIANPINA